jgi:hypothetical protein
VSRLLRALEKVGLVEVEPQAGSAVPGALRDAVPLDRLAAAAPEPAAVPEPVAEPTVAVASGPIVEQRQFDAIYAEGQVAASPFPAEKLLRILDGLAALDPPARKAAVLALDAADEAWTLDDALLDAERKVRALDLAKRALENQARSELEHARAAIEEREQRQQEAVARIRQQIADLEGLLEREVARATEEKSALQEAARAAKDACQRESARYDAEAARLKRLAEIFAPAPAPGARA